MLSDFDKRLNLKKKKKIILIRFNLYFCSYTPCFTIFFLYEKIVNCSLYTCIYIH